MCYHLILNKMHSSFDSWKEKRGKRGEKARAGVDLRPVTSRVRVMSIEGEGTSDGVQSFNQMMRTNRPPSERPASGLGSVRSFRSVMTVEEQVNAVEARMERVEEKVESIQEKLEENNKLLAQVLESLKAKPTTRS